MKRYIIPAILAAFLAVSLLPAPTYTYVVRELSQTFTAVQTFSAGLALNGTGTGSGSLHLDGGIGATDGNKVNLEGLAGDTYLKRDPDTTCVQEWKDGALTWQFCANRVIPPDCASTNPAPEFGSICKNQTTGEVLMRTGAGLIALTGAAR